MQKPLSDPNIFKNGLLCELVLKDELTFQIAALEIFPKTRGGGHSYIIEDMDVRQGSSNHYPFADQNFCKILDPLQTNDGTFSKIYTVFPRFTAPVRVSAPARFSTPPIRLQILISAPVRVSVPPSDKRLLQIDLDFDQKDGVPELFLINWKVNH